MKGLAAALSIALAVCAFAPTPVTAGDAVILLEYAGFDYEDPDPDPTMFGEAGSGFVGVGFVTGAFPPLVIDQVANEYTFCLSGGISTARHVQDPLYAAVYTTGTLTVYEDSRSTGTPAAYGTAPPNATAPSTFTDGTAILIGDAYDFALVFNTELHEGSCAGLFFANGGSQLSNFQPGERSAIFLRMLLGDPTTGPSGYDHSIPYGRLDFGIIDPARTSTWGRIKAAYR